MALLYNIINSYEKKETNRIRFISTAKEEHMEIFDELVSNRLYQDFSRCSLKIGKAGKNKNALHNFNMSKKLLFQDKFRKIFKNAEVSIAFNLIFFKMSVKFKNINFNERHLPPIVSLNT